MKRVIHWIDTHTLLKQKKNSFIKYENNGIFILRNWWNDYSCRPNENNGVILVGLVFVEVYNIYVVFVILNRPKTITKFWTITAQKCAFWTQPTRPTEKLQ